MSNYTRSFSEKGNRGPSPTIFGDLARHQHNEQTGKCLFLFDDFARPPRLTASNTTAISGKYYSFLNTGVVAGGPTGVADVGDALGELSISGNDADNDQGYVQFSTGNPFVIQNDHSGNTGLVYFETRMKVASIADNSCAFFAGLGQGLVADNDLVDDTGALAAAKAYIGIRRLNDDGDKTDIVFQAASQTLNAVITNASTLVANTYFKFGFRYDPWAVDSAKRIKFFLDGVEQSTYVTDTEINAATFPEGEALTPMLLTKVGTAAESIVTVDWVAAIQYGDEQPF